MKELSFSDLEAIARVTMEWEQRYTMWSNSKASEPAKVELIEKATKMQTIRDRCEDEMLARLEAL